jgi:DNA polymerase I-like protein with 3'-5' exonuclease and polymerase domains
MDAKLVSVAELRDFILGVGFKRAPLTLAIDTETTVVPLDKEVPELVVISITGPDLSVPAPCKEGDRTRRTATKTLVCWLRGDRDGAAAIGAALQITGADLVFHNAAFDLTVLEEAGMFNRRRLVDTATQGMIHDTMILDQLLRLAFGGEGPGRPGEAYYHKQYDGTLPRRSLSDLHEDLLGTPLEKGAVRTSYGDVEGPERLTAEQVAYAGQDALATWRVYWELAAAVPLDRYKWGPLSEGIQVAGAVALWDIGRRGLCVDQGRLEAKQVEERERMYEAGCVLDEAGILKSKIGPRSRKAEVKISEKALRSYLMEWAMENQHHGLRYTKTGRISISKQDWDSFRGKDDVIDAFLTYKAGEKLDRTFIRRWMEYSAEDGVIRARYRPMVASGRVSCHRPNLQQVPKRSGSLRDVFMARVGFHLYELDYSTLELCCLAQCCIDRFGSSVMADKINEGADLHRYIASKIYQKPEDEITKEERFLAKMVNFGFGGGMGHKTFRGHAWRLARLELEEDFCRKLRNVWLDAYPEMRAWLRAVPDPDLKQLLDVPGVSGWDINKVLRGRRMDVDLTDDQIGKIFGRLAYYPKKFRLDPERYPRSKRLVADLMQGKGSPALLDWVCWRESVTRTGRRRRPVSYTEWLNTQFQGLAADGAKLAMASLWEQGVRVCAFVHDSFIIELPDEPVARLQVMAAQDTMIREMQRVVPDVKISVEIEGPFIHWGEPID